MLDQSDIFSGVGIRVNIKSPENFLQIKETLTRIGLSPKNEKTLYQSCHILHKRDLRGDSVYAIVHFKEMFKLDGKESLLTDSDIARRNSIVRLLEEWNLVEVYNQDDITNCAPMSNIKVVSFKEKNNWNLVPKYKIGKK
jgi:hypothetical protein